MASQIQVKRRIGGTQAAPTGANIEGDVALFFPGAAGDATKPTLYANDGGGWRIVNPDPNVSVSNWNIPQPTGGWGADAATDINALAAARTIAQGEIVIVSWNGNAYAFTGGAGDWGATGAATPGTAVTNAMLTPLGAAPPAPHTIDLTGQNTAADIGAAYTAWNTLAPTTNVTTSGTNLAAWNGQVYVLTNLASPGTAASWTPISQDIQSEVIDFTGMAAGISGAADIGAAYTAWNSGAGTPDYTGSVVIVKFGDPAEFYILTDPANPGTAASYAKISPPAIDAVTFRAALDVTAALPDALPYAGWNTGDFAIISASGAVDTTDNTGGTSWDDVLLGAAASVNQGDILLWDGTAFHVLALETDLTAYLALSGGTMTDGAKVTFDTTTAAALPETTAAEIATKQAAMVVIDGAGGTIDNAVLDAGTY